MRFTWCWALLTYRDELKLDVEIIPKLHSQSMGTTAIVITIRITHIVFLLFKVLSEYSDIFKLSFLKLNFKIFTRCQNKNLATTHFTTTKNGTE